jgi:predicted nucleotidyltransferase
VLPELTDDGELPPGVHIADWQEFQSRFGISSPRRLWLSGRLRTILELAASGGRLRRVFVWGSFVTAKPAPKDLDILLIMSEDFETDRMSAPAQAVFDSTRTKLLSDIFWARASIAQELLDLWPDTYRTPEPFENAILWNRCCHDSNGRPNAPRAAIRWQDYRRPDSVLSCDSHLPADDRKPSLQATFRKRIRKLSRERRTHLTTY